MPDFPDYLQKAQAGNKEAMEVLIKKYKYLILKMSYNHEGEFDEDLMQILYEKFIKVTRKFKF